MIRNFYEFIEYRKKDVEGFDDDDFKQRFLSKSKNLHPNQRGGMNIWGGGRRK